MRIAWCLSAISSDYGSLPMQTTPDPRLASLSQRFAKPHPAASTQYRRSWVNTGKSQRMHSHGWQNRPDMHRISLVRQYREGTAQMDAAVGALMQSFLCRRTPGHADQVLGH